MENLLEYCTDLLDEQGQLDKSFDFHTAKEANDKHKELLEKEESGLFVQVWHRESEDNPVCLISEKII